MSMRYLSLALLVSLDLCVVAPAYAVAFSVFTDPHPVLAEGTIGFAFAGNKFVGSVQRDGTGALYSTDLNGGNVQVFAPTVSLAANPSSEHFLTSSLGLGGFPSRDIYVASANGIVHITNDGGSSDVFVSGLSGAVRGILFDSVGSFGHDMLVTTILGNVYRIKSDGSTQLLAAVGEDTEGLDIAPPGFGAFGGQLVVASEGSGRLRAITTGGVVTDLSATFGFTIPGAEELTFVPLNLGASGNPVEGFYGANYTPNVVKADASQFAGFQGDAIVTSETTGHVFRVHWNGSTFVVTDVGQFPNQPEDGIFVTAAIINPRPGPAPETIPTLNQWGTFGLILLLAAASVHRIRKRSVATR